MALLESFNYGGHRVLDLNVEIYEEDNLVQYDPNEIDVTDDEIDNIGLIGGVAVGGVILVTIISLVIYKVKKSAKTRKRISV